jgi:hypothetical protein
LDSILSYTERTFLHSKKSEEDNNDDETVKMEATYVASMKAAYGVAP